MYRQIVMEYQTRVVTKCNTMMMRGGESEDSELGGQTERNNSGILQKIAFSGVLYCTQMNIKGGRHTDAREEAIIDAHSEITATSATPLLATPFDNGKFCAFVACSEWEG